MGSKERVFMRESVWQARRALQPSMIFAKCGNCGVDLDVDAPADSESAPITYSCYECELAWDSSGKPTRYEEWGV